MTSPLAIWKQEPSRPTVGSIFAKVQRLTQGIGVRHTREAARRHIGSVEQLKSFDARNPMTPATIECRIIDAGNPDRPTKLVEISHGDFMGKDLFGLTVYELRLDLEQRDHDLSCAAHSPEEVAEKLREIAAA